MAGAAYEGADAEDRAQDPLARRLAGGRGPLRTPRRHRRLLVHVVAPARREDPGRLPRRGPSSRPPGAGSPKRGPRAHRLRRARRARLYGTPGFGKGIHSAGSESRSHLLDRMTPALVFFSSGRANRTPMTMATIRARISTLESTGLWAAIIDEGASFSHGIAASA